MKMRKKKWEQWYEFTESKKNNLIYKGTESENDLELKNEENIKIKEGHTDTGKNWQPIFW